MEVNIIGKQPEWKMTPMEMTIMEVDLNERLPQWKRTSMDDDPNEDNPIWR
jgi:hypothetical protein